VKKSAKHPRVQLLRAQRRFRDASVKLQERLAPILALTEAQERKIAQMLAPFDKLRLRSMSEEERNREEERKWMEKYWKEVAEALSAGHLQKLHDAFNAFGFRAYTEPAVHAVLQALEEDLVSYKRTERERAKKIREKISRFQTSLDSGRPPLPTEKQRQQSKRESTRTSKNRYDREVRQEVERLKTAVLKERMGHKPTIALARAQASNRAATRKAASLVQQKLDKGKL
jgi:hypothetical protein